MNIEARFKPSEVRNASEFLKFSDALADSPHTPPSVFLFGSSSNNNYPAVEHWRQGYVHMDELVYAVLVDDPDPNSHQLLGPLDYRDIHDSFMTDNHKHIPNEVVEYLNNVYENIVHDIFWDDRNGLSLVVPSQRMTNYLGLMQQDSDIEETTRWRLPSSDDDVIVRQGEKNANGNRSLTIAYDHLRDYLAARSKCLLVYRWASRRMVLDQADELPWRDASSILVNGGVLELFGAHESYAPGGVVLGAELQQRFIIEPAETPSHWRLTNRKEVEYYADFIDEIGNVAIEKIEFGNPQIISLNRSVLALFNRPDRPKWHAEETDQGRIYLGMPQGDGLICSNSEHGQIQVLLRDLGKLSKQNQLTIAPFSEMKRGEVTTEWWDCFFNCVPPDPNPWHKLIAEKQKQLHEALAELVISDNPIKSEPSSALPRILIRPYQNDPDSFFSIAAELRRSLFIENVSKRDWYNLDACDPFKQNCGSMGAIRGYVSLNGTENQAEEVNKSLNAIQIFRQVNAHGKTVDSALADAGYDGVNYADHYTKLMSELVRALDIVLSLANS